MTAQVEDVKIFASRRVDIQFGPGLDPLTPNYKKGHFRPKRVTLTWNRRDDGWFLAEAKVGGPMLKKDGADSQNSGDLTFGGHRRKLDDAPDWLRDLIDYYAPGTES